MVLKRRCHEFPDPGTDDAAQRAERRGQLGLRWHLEPRRAKKAQISLHTVGSRLLRSKAFGRQAGNGVVNGLQEFFMCLGHVLQRNHATGNVDANRLGKSWQQCQDKPAIGVGADRGWNLGGSIVGIAGVVRCWDNNNTSSASQVGEMMWCVFCFTAYLRWNGDPPSPILAGRGRTRYKRRRWSPSYTAVPFAISKARLRHNSITNGEAGLRVCLRHDR